MTPRMGVFDSANMKSLLTIEGRSFAWRPDSDAIVYRDPERDRWIVRTVPDGKIVKRWPAGREIILCWTSKPEYIVSVVTRVSFRGWVELSYLRFRKPFRPERFVEVPVYDPGIFSATYVEHGKEFTSGIMLNLPGRLGP